MDEELRAYLEGMEARILQRLNDVTERLSNRMGSLESDFQNTKGFLIGDAAVSSRRWLDLEERVTRIERGGRSTP
jgi:hypothetical protein